MPTYRAQVVIPFFTNLPGDVMTNTFHFDPLTPLGFNETADLVQPSLITFYNSIYGGTNGIATYMEPDLAHVNWYDLAEPPPRVPYTLPLAPNTMSLTASVIPTEVACVLSFQGPQVPGMPQARRRGRIFLGGLSTAWIAPGTGGAFPRFTAGVLSSVPGAANTLRQNVLDDGVRWTVWSPTDQASAIVTNGWVDDSPDTQRRRSVDATARTLWSEP